MYGCVLAGKAIRSGFVLLAVNKEALGQINGCVTVVRRTVESFVCSVEKRVQEQRHQQKIYKRQIQLKSKPVCQMYNQLKKTRLKRIYLVLIYVKQEGVTKMQSIWNRRIA